MSATENSPKGIHLAIWQAGSNGLDWIDELVKEEKAIDLGGNGYPSFYTAKAEHLLPTIIKGPPHVHNVWIVEPQDILLEGYLGKTVIDHSAIADCLPDEWLLVEVWDES